MAPVSRDLRAVEADPAVLLAALPGALDGTGPALLPLPDGPTRDATLRMGRPDRPLESPGVALVVPTSGSTGEPKGALLRGDALRHSARATLDRLGGSGQWLLALPVTHVAGIQVLVRSVVAGTEPVVLDLAGGFDPAVFAAATARLDPGVRHYTALVPTQLRRLLEAGVDLSPYDAVLVGGAALRFPAPDNVVRTYGMTETCGGCVYDGRPLDGVEVRIDPDGRVSLGGPVLFDGYRLRPDLTGSALVDGRYRTQDLGRISDDGRLEVLGRADNMIISGGENVPAGLVERVLADHPAVDAVAVVGAPDPEWGERVVAVVESTDPPSLADLRAYAADRLPSAALPRQVVLVAHLPLLPSGKPDLVRLRNLAAGSGDPAV